MGLLSSESCRGVASNLGPDGWAERLTDSPMWSYPSLPLWMVLIFLDSEILFSVQINWGIKPWYLADGIEGM